MHMLHTRSPSVCFSNLSQNKEKKKAEKNWLTSIYLEQEIRSVEHGICPIVEFASPYWIVCIVTEYRILFSVDVVMYMYCVKILSEYWKVIGCSNRYRDIVIFKLLGCWLPPSWISLDVKFVTDQTVTRAELRHRAKFCWNCAEIWRFFKIVAAAKLDFWNYKVLTVGSIISVAPRHR